MPGSYPASPPTLSGDLETISRFLQSPTQLRRRLRDFHDLRFVSDQILTQRFRTSGGAALYEQSEPFVTDRSVEAVGAGAEYPMANMPTGTAGIAAVSKWGQKVRVTDEEIARNVYAGQTVDRALRKVVNSIIQQVDSVTMSAIQSIISGSLATLSLAATGTAGSAWTSGTPVMLRDILLAKAKVFGRNLGYKPDTLLVNDSEYAYMMSDTAITNALRRETTDNPVYTGMIEVIAGLTIVVAGSNSLGSTDSTHGGPVILDSTQLGGMADEQDAAPGYAVSDLATEVKSIRLDANDAWDLQGRRKTVPIVQETGAMCQITGTGL
jgi:hypothetical protein